MLPANHKPTTLKYFKQQKDCPTFPPGFLKTRGYACQYQSFDLEILNMIYIALRTTSYVQRAYDLLDL